MSIQEILESAGLPAQRGVYTGRDKPDAYYTFLRLLGTPAVNADDEEKAHREMYRVTLFHKGDFEAQLDKTKEVLKATAVTDLSLFILTESLQVFKILLQILKL